jgi:RHS repeat-associated protein
VTINGANFGATQGKVNFYGAAATSITSWSNSQIVVAVPPGASYGNVVVTVNGAPSNGVPFNVTTPIIWSLSGYNAGPSGAIGSHVTIEGQNFGTAQGTVTLNGVPATINQWTCPVGCSSYSFIPLITFTVPAGATTGNVVVKTASGVLSNGMSFTVTLRAPTLSVTSNITPSTAGSPVTFTATITNGPTSGTISFYDGLVPIGTGTITGTTAQFTTSSLAAGDHAIIATYAGNSQYPAASSLFNPDIFSIYQYAYIQTVTGTPKLPAAGLIGTIAGNGLSNISTDGTGLYAFPGDSFAATSANLNGPVGIAVDSVGNVYFADAGNCSIREVLATSTVPNASRSGMYAAGDITNVAGTSSAASCGADTGYGTSWPAIGATLYWPTGVGLDASGDVYIADTNNDVVREVTVNVASTISSLSAYVTIAGSNNQQIPGYSGDGASATSALLNGPSGVAVDASGNVYIADTSNNVIRKVNPQGVISTVVGTSTQGYSGDGGPAASANLSWPVGVAVDRTGNLYIADSGNNVIRKVAAPVTSTSTISTVAGNSGDDYSGDDGPATSAELSGPSGVAVDSSGNLYIADSYNNVIRKVTAATGIISTVAGSGSEGFSGDGGVATNAELDNPSGVAVDAAGNIYISDTQNQRIRVVGASKTVPTITWAEPSAINYGTVLTSGSAPLNATVGSIAGTYAYAIASSTLPSTAASGYMPKVGTYTVSVTFTPTDATHYSSAAASVTLTVNQIPAPIVWAVPASITDKTALSAAQLNATSPAAGAFIYSPTAGTVLKSGPQLLTVTLTPTDTADYLPNTTTVSINVVPGGTSDTGLVTLTVAGNTVASTSYGAGATPTTVAQGLAGGTVGGAPVKLTAVGSALYIEATGAGSSTNYPYSLQTVNYDNQHFSQPSFLSMPIAGTLEGGADPQPAGTSSVVYSYQVPAGYYDGDGNVLGYVDSVMGAWAFSYDTLNRLSTATAGASAPAAFAGEYGCWSYDSFGNRLMQSMSTTPCTNNPPLMSWANYTVDGTLNTADNGKNQVKGTPNGIYQYDSAGNVIYDGHNWYLYDGAGRICAVANTALPGLTTMTGYLYDANGQRVAKGSISSWSCNPAVNRFQTLSDYVLGPGGEQMTEMGVDTKAGSNASTLAWQHTNVWAGGNLIATYDNDGLHFYLSDPLGTRRVQTDYAGVIEQTCQGLPYGDGLNCLSATKGANGTVYAGSLSAPTEHHFTGKERDAESGNDYFGARYYASSMGRWLSPDWSLAPDTVPYADFNDPQSLNLYAYAGNNPITYGDSNGHVYTLCDQNGHCEQGISDKDFEDREKNARLAGEHWSDGKITLADGSAGGTYTWGGDDLPGDAASNRAGAQMIATDGKGAINMMLTNIATSLAGGVVARGIGWAAEALADSGAINTGVNAVYRSVNAAGDVQYVGITNNLARRAAEHAGRFVIEEIPGLSNLSRADAKAVEQVLIETHGLASNGGTLLNKINSIASTNPAYAQALQRGAQILKQVGYFK